MQQRPLAGIQRVSVVNRETTPDALDRTCRSAGPSSQGLTAPDTQTHSGQVGIDNRLLRFVDFVRLRNALTYLSSSYSASQVRRVKQPTLTRLTTLTQLPRAIRARKRWGIAPTSRIVLQP